MPYRLIGSVEATLLSTSPVHVNWNEVFSRCQLLTCNLLTYTIELKKKSNV